MKTRVIQIGNSRGIRIPKGVLDQLDLEDTGEVDLTVQRDRLVVSPVRGSRHGWEEQFQAMAQRGDDLLLDEEKSTQWEETEWEW
ncbi:AbrB/MazE/SpoVT family DNA-binding domain-containing protein [bacterium]|nr:AbrB/MazE/SpoVT family DNA-binding domain-containing protein [bacterium]